MSSKIKILLISIALIVTFLIVVFLAWSATKKAVVGPDREQKLQRESVILGKELEKPKENFFELGEFVATTRDEELHYIKIEVVVVYTGNLEQELKARKAELRDTIISMLMRLTIQRAKEDFIDRFLHKDIEKALNQVLGTTTSESRITKVFIPTFLIN